MNEDDSIKNEGARVATTCFPLKKSMGIFPDPQGHLTPQSLVGFGRLMISNSFEILWLSSLPARMKKIKNEGAGVSQQFPLYNPMGAICCHGNQNFDPIWPKT